MKSAVVTGTSSGIGRACTKMLLDQGWRVFGISREPVVEEFTDRTYTPCRCDLTDTHATQKTCSAINKATGRKIHLLLNCAGMGAFAPHEEISASAIHTMIALNLQAPVMLSNIFLRSIRATKGFIINIASITAIHAAPRGCAYAATKAGLLHFSRSLFEETRRTGVKVTCIMPDLTRTNFFNKLDFEPDDQPDTVLEPEAVAKAVKQIISAGKEGSVITEMVIRPQRFGINRKA